MDPALGPARRPWIFACVALATILVFVPTGGEAQPAKRPYRIGALNEGWAANHPTVLGLKAGLRELGLQEVRDVTFDVRFSKGDPEATRAAAQALAQAGVDLIFTSDEAATRATRTATQAIPIVFTLVGDPVAAGIVKRLAYPGGNVTGVSSLTTDLVVKRLEVLKKLVPGTRRVWAIHYGGDPSSVVAVVKAQEAAGQLDLDLLSRPVSKAEQLERALKDIRPGDALLPPDIATMDIPAAILETSLSSRLPAVFAAALWVEHGALASYGPDYYGQGVQAARLVAKILQGARPQDLPVEAADQIHLALNLKTAALLGVTVPQKLLFRADLLRR